MIDLKWQEQHKCDNSIEKDTNKQLSTEQMYEVNDCINRLKKNAKSNNKFYAIIPDYVFHYIVNKGINARIKILQRWYKSDDECWIEISKLGTKA